jgi:hypothetical protein
MKQKLSERKLKAIIKDEIGASKMYKKLGYKSQSKDEKRHYKFFKNKYKKMEKAEHCKCVVKNSCKRKK